MANAVKKKEESNVVQFDPSMFEADANQGLGVLEQDDLAIPFLRILGDNSPQVKKRDPKYVNGAEPGMLFNSLTHDVIDGEKGISVIPCAYVRQYIEWQDRGQGTGAPVNIYPASSDILSKTTRDEFRKDRLPNGNYIEDTANHFVLFENNQGIWEQALIAMKSTQRKKSKRWNSLMLGLKIKGSKGLFTPPSYSHIYTMKSMVEQNDLGTWFGWDISRDGPVKDQDIYQQAKAFSASVAAGDVKVKHEDESSEGAEEAPY